MKKLLFLALPLVVFSGVASAATACSGLSFSLAGLEALNASGGCSIGDKVFTNFTGTFTGTDVNDQISLSASGNNYFLNLNAATGAGLPGTLSSTLTFGFQVQVIQSLVTAGNTAAITRVTGGFQDNGDAGSAGTLAKTIGVVTGTGSCPSGVLVTDNAGNVTTSPCTGISATVLNVNETFTFTGTGASSVTGFGNTFAQTLTPSSGTPEPFSMLLFGSGLLALASIGRKKLARK
jgi:hypothetical protein